jgi:hypothetical protein
MRRSRAFVLFGWFLTLLAVATVTARSHAADRTRLRPSTSAAAAGVLAGRPSSELLLLPRPPTHDSAALFGSFAKPSASPDAFPTEVPGEAGCPPEMVEVDGDYCPYVEQKCLRWLDPATKLQCAEFDKSATAARCPMKTQHKRFCIDR